MVVILNSEMQKRHRDEQRALFKGIARSRWSVWEVILHATSSPRPAILWHLLPLPPQRHSCVSQRRLGVGGYGAGSRYFALKMSLSSLPLCDLVLNSHTLMQEMSRRRLACMFFWRIAQLKLPSTLVITVVPGILQILNQQGCQK